MFPAINSLQYKIWKKRKKKKNSFHKAQRETDNHTRTSTHAANLEWPINLTSKALTCGKKVEQTLCFINIPTHPIQYLIIFGGTTTFWKLP